MAADAAGCSTGPRRRIPVVVATPGGFAGCRVSRRRRTVRQSSPASLADDGLPDVFGVVPVRQMQQDREPGAAPCAGIGPSDAEHTEHACQWDGPFTEYRHMSLH